MIGSLDNSGKICDWYAKRDKRINVIHKKNGGVSSARNLGLEKANGKYISFVDGDDWLELDAYKEMLEQMKEKDVDVVRCGFYRDNEIEHIEQKYIFEQNTRIDMKLKRVEILNLYATKKMHADVCFLLIKKECIDRIQKFNLEVVLGEDLIFVLDLVCSINSIYYFNKSFYHYYTNVNSATKSITNIDKKIKSLLNLNININEILTKYNIKNEELKKNFLILCFNKIYDIVKNYTFTEKKMDIIELVMQDCNMEEMINEIKYKDLSIYKKFFLFLLKKKCKKLVYVYCYLIEWIIKKLKI